MTCLSKAYCGALASAVASVVVILSPAALARLRKETEITDFLDRLVTGGLATLLVWVPGVTRPLLRAHVTEKDISSFAGAHDTFYYSLTTLLSSTLFAISFARGHCAHRWGAGICLAASLTNLVYISPTLYALRDSTESQDSKGSQEMLKVAQDLCHYFTIGGMLLVLSDFKNARHRLIQQVA